MLTRIEVLQKLDLGGARCTEVGVLQGDFAAEIHKCDPHMLTLVDPWKAQEYHIYNDYNNWNQEKFDEIYQGVVDRFAAHNNVDILRMFSHDGARHMMRYISDGPSQDFVNIDANHSFAHTFANLAMWSVLVRDGGTIMVHDFGKCMFYGVRQAVTEFCKATRYKVEMETAEPSCTSAVIRIA